jgi:hypothetical protein
MVSVPAPREFQYVERSIMMFLPAVLLVTIYGSEAFDTQVGSHVKGAHGVGGIVSVLTTLPFP